MKCIEILIANNCTLYEKNIGDPYIMHDIMICFMEYSISIQCNDVSHIYDGLYWYNSLFKDTNGRLITLFSNLDYLSSCRDSHYEKLLQIERFFRRITRISDDIELEKVSNPNDYILKLQKSNLYKKYSDWEQNGELAIRDEKCISSLCELNNIEIDTFENIITLIDKRKSDPLFIDYSDMNKAYYDQFIIKCIDRKLSNDFPLDLRDSFGIVASEDINFIIDRYKYTLIKNVIMLKDEINKLKKTFKPEDMKLNRNIFKIDVLLQSIYKTLTLMTKLDMSTKSRQMIKTLTEKIYWLIAYGSPGNNIISLIASQSVGNNNFIIAELLRIQKLIGFNLRQNIYIAFHIECPYLADDTKDMCIETINKLVGTIKSDFDEVIGKCNLNNSFDKIKLLEKYTPPFYKDIHRELKYEEMLFHPSAVTSPQKLNNNFYNMIIVSQGLYSSN